VISLPLILHILKNIQKYQILKNIQKYQINQKNIRIFRHSKQPIKNI